MAVFWAQVRLLLWKNVLLQKRKMCVSVFEIIIPVFFAVLLATLRLLLGGLQYHNDSTYFRSHSMDMRNLDTTCVLGYVPDHPSLRKVMARLPSSWSSYSCNIPAQIQAFKTEADLVYHYKANYNDRSKSIDTAVVFEGDFDSSSATLPKHIHMNYRLDPKYNNWYTKQVMPSDILQPSDYNSQKYRSVVTLQALLGQALVNEWTGQNLSRSWEYQAMPYPPYVTDNLATSMSFLLPIFLLISFLLPVIQYTKSIVYEKQQKLKESMKLMGLLPSAHWTAWFITCMVYMTVIMAVYTLFVGVALKPANGPVLGKSDASLFFVFMLVYSVALVTFCFMISAVIQRANIAAVVAALVYIILFIPYLATTGQILTHGQKMAMSLCFNSALGLGAKVYSLYLGTGGALKWSTINESAIPDDAFVLSDAIVMLLVDSAIHLLVTWYLDNVRPGTFGVPKPLYFPFMKSYWCGADLADMATNVAMETDSKNFEPAPQGMKTGIAVKKLRKEFAREKIAVHNLSLNMLEGQITVLLGHNGAGKTTTMFMLTGFIPPTSGTALINGLDIRKDMDSIRRNLGLCPQHNILFDSMTVDEHLEFFAKLKGCPSSRVREEVDRMVVEVGLQTKRFAQSSTLSGGQKRKLSVAIALINGSKIVILDEPTSGMDPAARRQTWELLQRCRAGRTVLLSTHFMDEADVLGDRIAIMAEGVLQCCGTSMFLKKLYGTGYHLTLVKAPECQVQRVTAVVQRHVATARLESEINTELCYLLPDNQTPSFPDLFRQLQAEGAELGVGGFGITATTMEEVFLKVGEISVAAEEHNKAIQATTSSSFSPSSGSELDNLGFVAAEEGQRNGLDDTTVGINANFGNRDILAFNCGFDKLTGAALQLTQFRAMLVKKVLHTWRNRLITAIQFVLPITFTALALYININSSEENVPVSFTLDPFGRTHVPYSNGSSLSAQSQAVADAYAAQTGLSGQDRENMDLQNTARWPNASSYFLQRAKDLSTSVYNRKMVIGAQFSTEDGADHYRAWYGSVPFHSLPTAMHYLVQGFVRQEAGSDYSVSSGMTLFPAQDDDNPYSSNGNVDAIIQGYITAMMVSFGVAFLVSPFVYLVVKERQVGAKHLQEVSGVGPVVFWGANLAWDYVNYLVPALVMLVVFAGFQTPGYTEFGNLGAVALLLLLFGWAILPLMYLFSFLFKSPPTAMVVVIMFNALVGLITTMMTKIMLVEKDPKGIANMFFLIFLPNHCLSTGFIDLQSNYVDLSECNKQNYAVTCLSKSGECCKGIGQGCQGGCKDFTDNPLTFEPPGIGRTLFLLLVQGFVYLTVTLLIEYHAPQRLKYLLRGGKQQRAAGVMQSSVHAGQEWEDGDVAEEKRRIRDAQVDQLCKTDAVLLTSLFKHYGALVAVNNVSVGVPENECFGLLGQNGAGKTSIFKMLTGLVTPSAGNAYVKGWDIRENIKQVQSNLGYCPQFDALHDQLSGRETLTMYARLRGVPGARIDHVVTSLIDTLLLSGHADKLTAQYSGGTKRKLSTAISLVGDPAFILLDEPSSGMDPAARRHLWNVLSGVRASGRTLVLTSHSMDECEALCTRLAIMVNAGVVCLGSPQHLKSKFGQGYTLLAKLPSSAAEGDGEGPAGGQDWVRAPQGNGNGGVGGGPPNPQQQLINFVYNVFPSVRVFDQHQGYVHLQLQDPNVQLADVFTLMERAKHDALVLDYSVHMTTLEQVFLAFTRRQFPPNEAANKSCLSALCCCCRTNP